MVLTRQTGFVMVLLAILFFPAKVLCQTGQLPDIGDGGPAVMARLFRPQGVAIDIKRDIYIADGGHNRIRKIDHATGIISTLNYNEREADGSLSARWIIDFPRRLAFDKAGNLYVMANQTAGAGIIIYRIDALTHLITTVAGGGELEAVDGALATSLHLWRGMEMLPDSSGGLYIAINSQNIYYGHWTNRDILAIFKVDAATGAISRVAGSGQRGSHGDGGPAVSAELSNISGMAADAKGILYIADQTSCVIRKVNFRGIIARVAGRPDHCQSTGDNGPAIRAGFRAPSSIVIDKAGNLYVADYGSIRRIDARTRLITTLGMDEKIDARRALSSQAHTDSARLMPVDGLALNASGALYIVDAFHSVIRKIDSSGLTTVAGRPWVLM